MLGTLARTSPIALAVAVALLPALAAGAGTEAEPGSAAALRATLDAIVDESALPGARAGLCVVSLDSGATLYARDADVLLNPASNVKLFTTAAALGWLGPEYRFETEVWLDPPGGARTIYLRGKGDPTLTTERLWALAGDLARLGPRTFGDLVLDEGWFDGARVGAGFDQESGDKSYLAPTGALSLNFNSVAIHVAPGARSGQPGRVDLEPASAHFELVNLTRTAGPRATRRLTITSSPDGAGGRQRITVEGRLPAGQKATVAWRKVDDPPRYLGETLRRLMEQRGLRLVGQVRLGPVAPAAQLAQVVESEPLAEVVRKLNKSSNNFVGEQLLKALGAATAGPPGTAAAGLAAVERFLATIGIPRGAYLMTNGSGLNDANRFSARQTALLLAELWRRFSLAPEFVGSLPVAGRDGTIRWRLEAPEVAGKVRAKTGTLDGVAALSGYAETATRERVAFALIVNDAPGRAGAVTSAIDRLTAALVTRGAPTGSERVAGSAAPPAAPPSRGAAPPAVPAVPPSRVARPSGPNVANVPSGSSTAPGDEADLDAAAQTYLALGRSADRRNVAFLRSALRAEAAPELRLAAAEALYRSDPDGDAARRGLLEGAAALSEPPLARLLPLVPAGAPAPVLAALGDLAGEGNGTALALLLGLAPALPPAGATRDAWRAVLGEVAEAAPGDLAAALASAPAPTREAAAALLPAVRPGG